MANGKERQKLKEFWSFKTDKEKGQVGIHRAIGVGCWDMFNSGTGGLIGSWLLYFLTSFGHVNPAIAALLISVRLFVDMIWAPIVAVISDNFYRFAIGRKFGRRRCFLIFCIPTSAAFVAMWIPMQNGLSWLYYLVTMVVFDFCLDLILIPWETLPAEMTEDFNQKNKMGTFRMWMAGLAQPLVAWVPTFFMGILPASEGEKASPWALFATALLWGIMGILFTLFVFLSSWDPINVSEERRNLILKNLEIERLKMEGVSPATIIAKNFANLALTLRIKSFRKHLILYFSTFGVIDSYTTIFVIFASVSFLPVVTIDPQAAGVILAVPLLVMTFLWSPVSAILLNNPKIGPKFLYTTGFGLGLCACAMYGVIFFMKGGITPATVWLLVIVAHCIFTVGRQIMGGVPWVVYPMMADIDEVVSRDKRAGVYAGAMTFVRKFTNAAFNIIIGAVMGMCGYSDKVSDAASQIAAAIKKGKITDPGKAQEFAHIAWQQIPAGVQQQMTGAGFGIAMLMVFFVGALFVWALWNAVTFKLNSNTHEILMNEIDRLRAVDVTSADAIKKAKAEVTPETKKTVEVLTGLDYDQFAWSGDVFKGDDKTNPTK